MARRLVILRHDPVAVIVPHHSSISSLADLAGKTVAIPTGPAQDDNSHALDLLLSFYNLTPDRVKRQFLAAADIGPAIEHKQVVAAVAVGPVGPGPVVDTVASIGAATKGTPKILGFDDADAIVKRFPMFESYDVPEGGFRPKPPVPDDSVTMLAVNYRFAVPITMLDIVADAIGRSILTAKAQLMNVAPMAGQIEAPDVSRPESAAADPSGFRGLSLERRPELFRPGAALSLYFRHSAERRRVAAHPFGQHPQCARLEEGSRGGRAAALDRPRGQYRRSRAARRDGERIARGGLRCVAKTGKADNAEQWKTQLAMQHAMRRFERRDAVLKAEAALHPDAAGRDRRPTGNVTPIHSP